MPQDYTQAVTWFLKAIETGNARAQSNLGILYAKGNGVPQDNVLAYKWMNLAAAGGFTEAEKNRRIISGQMTREQIAEGQRLSREWLAKRDAKGNGTEGGRVNESMDGIEPKCGGTGFLITRSGYLVTNNHVVKGAVKVRVQTAAGFLAAKVVRVDEASDLALLKVNGYFDPLPVVSSRKVRLGATVATIGFPNVTLQGAAPKLSKGDISSLSGLHDDVRHFQISVPVQPGNSGGALIDEKGNVVGVVVSTLNQKAALETTGTLAQNVNFAVKSSYLLSFLEAMPEVSGEMVDERTDEREFETVVESVKKASVLVVGY